jgi:hypothetical protein
MFINFPFLTVMQVRDKANGTFGDLVDEIKRLNPFGIPFGASACESEACAMESQSLFRGPIVDDFRRWLRTVTHVWRAEIVLLTADGLGTNEVKRRTAKSKTCVWRRIRSVQALTRVRTRFISRIACGHIWKEPKAELAKDGIERAVVKRKIQGATFNPFDRCALA